MFGIDTQTGERLDIADERNNQQDGMGMTSRGYNMQLCSGKPFYPMMPSSDDIDIIDIAHSLSMQCRFNGHVQEFYSVAQHSVIVSHICSPEYALDGLLHDASEAYIGDIIRPVKYSIPGIDEIEDRIQKCIAEKFNLHWPMPPDVKRADFIALATEKRDLMAEPIGVDWGRLAEPLPQRIEPLGQSDAKRLFLERFRELTNGRR